VPEQPAQVQTGALDIPAFTYPPSILASDEQTRAYAKSLATPGDGTIPIPQDPKVVQFMRERVNAMFAQALPMVRERYPVDTAPAEIAGVEVIRVTPAGGVAAANSKRVLLNLHGGAFMVGWPSVALLDAIPVAALSGIEVITLNYRMYPEAVHPAALEDLAAVYREMLKTYAPENIGIFGGSAGGVVTLQSIPWFKSHDLPRPGAIGPLAASFRTAVGDSSIWNFNGGFAKPGADGTALIAKGGYFADMDRTEGVSDTSPATLQEYPPTLLLAGTRAPELSGAIDAHAKLLKQGVDSQLYVIEGGWHSSYSTAPQTPESQDAMLYVARWFDQHLGR
jgi:acetyl esterase/lipase